MANLDTEVRYLKGIGEARAALFAKLGIYTLQDLISHFPRDYEDRTEVFTIAAMPGDRPACVSAMIASPPKISHVRKGLQLTKVRVVDDQSGMDITFFNQIYVKDALIPGKTYIFFGIAEGAGSRRTMANPVFEPADHAGGTTGRIMPVYPLTAGISNNIMAKSAAAGLELCGDLLPDVLPEAVRMRYGLAHAQFAYRNIHMPVDLASLESARKRLIFEEFFVFSSGLALLKSRRTEQNALVFSEVNPEPFYAALPFAPTNAQKTAVVQAAEDLRSGQPMNRLLQGDVGSGKTLVAATLVYMCVKSGYQAAFMAPTEILAEQHFHTLSGFLTPLGISAELLTGSMKAAQKRAVREALALGQLDLVVGTHALISQNVDFARPGLAVVDEQHRFGVNQRALLSSKGDGLHTLVMSATPIPRTLALMMYGDLDISVLDEMPPGRQTVDTFLVDEGMRARINGFIRKLVAQGRQVFIVCPVIEESEDLKSAVEYAENLKRAVFPDLRVALVHGRMKASDKDAAMSAFSAGEYDILVATTVIEVGVDVPNAALMVIENAERFGLSQQHQLRGRVGRGGHKSFCVMFSKNPSEQTRQRLETLCKTGDGFEIARQDLRLRGPGDFFGERQHGLPRFRIADISDDMQLLRQAQIAASEFIAVSDPDAPENAPLISQIRKLFDSDIFN